MTSSRSNALAWWSALTILVSAFLLFQVQPIISKKILPWFGGSPAVWSTCVLFFQLVLLGGYAYAHWLIRYVPPRLQGPVHLSLLVLALLTFPITAAGGYWNIAPSDFWKPADGTMPETRILLLLAAKVGAAFFIASTTGPLVQAWFSQLYPGRSPYRLYALSNVGSLAALLTYPPLIEPMFRVNEQGWLWSLGFLLFAGLVGTLARAVWQEARKEQSTAAPITLARQPAVAMADGLVAKPGAMPAAGAAQERGQPADSPIDRRPPPGWLRAGWLLLAATASMALLAITNHLCQDIAVVPFMWVIPLSLYLLSFIICFDSERWYIRKLFGTATVLGILWLTAMLNYSTVDDWMDWAQTPLKGRAIAFQTAGWKVGSYRVGKLDVDLKFPVDFSDVMDKVLDGVQWTVVKLDAGLERLLKREFHLKFNVHTYDFFDDVVAASGGYLLVLFLICMACHGELVKSKPAPEHLTSFYLFISAGGALGGLFVALLCPMIFETYRELELTIIAGYVVGCVALANDGRQTWLKNREILQWSAAFVVVGGAILVARGNARGVDDDVIAIDRNFYGVVRVEEKGEGEERGRYLYNGQIWHGFQYVAPGRQLEPTTYYVPGTGAALAVQEHPRAGQGLRVAVIGLGTGSMAAYAQAGDVYRFYDIDPKVVNVARKYFTYLATNRAGAENTHVVLGDARISMERELKQGGSQNYDVIVLDAFSGDAIPAHLLTDESFALYEQHLHKDASGRPDGILAIHISNRHLDLEPVVAALSNKYGYAAIVVHKEEEGGALDTASDWVIVTKNEQVLNNRAVQEAGEPLIPEKELLWTDQFTALFPILK